MGYSDGTRLSFSYDDNNRLTSATGVALGYDENDRLISTNGITLTRDSEGRIATMTLAPGKTVNYGYDSRDLLTSVSDWAGGTTRFSYDDAGRLVTVTRPNGVITTYGYDNADRLTGIAEARGQTTLSSIALVKDGKGQTKQATRDVPLPPAVGKQNPNQTYNDADQIVGYTYDALGRLTGDGARTYSWDLASRLTSYNDGQSTITFTYDAFGDRLARTTEPRPSGSGQGATRNFVWNYALGIPSISVVKDDSNAVRYYIHTPGGALLYSVEDSGNARRFYHYDEIGSTLFLTDDSGNITDSYAYSPYGQLTAPSGISDNPFTYVGKYGVMREASADLYYMRSRYYDGATGRFLSRDPIGMDLFDAKSANPYQYVAQNPLRYVDPQGTDTVVCLVPDNPLPLELPRLDLKLIGECELRAGNPQYGAQSPIAPAKSTYAIANPYGDDFPIVFDSDEFIKLPEHPYLQPEPDVLMPVSETGVSAAVNTLRSGVGSADWKVTIQVRNSRAQSWTPGFCLTSRDDVGLPNININLWCQGDHPLPLVHGMQDSQPKTVRDNTSRNQRGLVEGFITSVEYRRRFGP